MTKPTREELEKYVIELTAAVEEIDQALGELDLERLRAKIDKALDKIYNGLGVKR